MKKNNKLVILLIFIILILFIFLYYLNKNTYELYTENTKKKYAICIWGQLRGIESTHDSFNNYLVKPLDADVYVVARNIIDDNDETIINIFNEDAVKYKKLNNAPDISSYFTKNNGENALNEYEYITANWKNEGNINHYINFNEVAKLIGNELHSNYDYIIMVRSDFLYLFDFPNILDIIPENLNDHFWCYSGHSYGGINYNLIVVPKKYLIEYLTACYKYIMDGTLHNIVKIPVLNCESYMQLIFNNNNWKIGYIQNNGFISANNSNDHTTWGKIIYSEEHNVLYKYREQLDNSYNALELWNNNKRWKYKLVNDESHILLE